MTTQTAPSTGFDLVVTIGKTFVNRTAAGDDVSNTYCFAATANSATRARKYKARTSRTGESFKASCFDLDTQAELDGIREGEPAVLIDCREEARTYKNRDGIKVKTVDTIYQSICPIDVSEVAQTIADIALDGADRDTWRQNNLSSKVKRTINTVKAAVQAAAPAVATLTAAEDLPF